MEEPEPRPDGADRYRIYRRNRNTADRLADTSLSGIGMTLQVLRYPEDGEEPLLTDDDIIGIRDRVERRWIVNPYAVGRRGA